MDKEMWKQIIGYEGIYSVSNFGNVRRDKPGHRTYVGRILKPQTNSRGYFHVILHRDGTRKTLRVHSLVTTSFIKNVRGRQFVNHKDGNKKNNTVLNLEYVTTSENHLHAYRNKLRIALCGSRHGAAKLTEAQVLDIRKKYAAGNYTHSMLGKEYGINLSYACQIIKRYRWKHI